VKVRVPSGVQLRKLLFTDTDMEYPGWEVYHIPMPGVANDMLRAKWWKLSPLDACPDADVSIWIDASVTVTNPSFLGRCISALGNDDWTLIPHPWRNCLYDEAAYCGETGMHNPAVMALQAAYYQSLGYPTGAGLYASTVLVRRHTDAVASACCSWWHDVTRWSTRDQVSLPVILREHPVPLNTRMRWCDGWTVGTHVGKRFTG